MARRFVTFLTDYGVDDEFAGVCRGVVKRIAPEVEILDVTHGIPPQDVLRGALVLADALPYFPVGIHVAVVDPGVGGDRRAIAARGADGRVYVGPDNGVLLLAADALGGVADAVEVVTPDYMLAPVSATFHGRDVFAPAAAHLALGVPLKELGPPIAPADLVRVDVPDGRVGDGELTATVLGIDRFGNVELNVGVADLGAAGIRAESVRVEVAHRSVDAALGRTFADVAPGELVLFEDSSGRMALGVNGGNAASATGLALGDEAVLRLP